MSKVRLRRYSTDSTGPHSVSRAIFSLCGLREVTCLFGSSLVR